MAITDFRLDASNVSWGKRTKTDVTLVADVADSLDGTYFTVSNTTTDHYVWLDGAVVADPAPAGKTAIPVVYTTGDSAIVLAGLIKTAMEAVGYWVLDNGDGTIEIEPKLVGAATGAVDVDTTFTFTASETGMGGSLGRTSDGIEISMEGSSFELKANQSGENLLGEIAQGRTVTATMNLIEMSNARWNQVIGNGMGDLITPVAGTEVIGFGTSKDSLNMFNLGGELQISPISDTSGTRNLVIWKCVPQPSSISFSGTDLQVMAVEFKAYVDDSKDTKVSIMAFGDVTQDMRV